MRKEKEQYEKLLQAVGIETFVKYYNVFKANRLERSNEAIKDAFRKGEEEWVDNASNTKASCGKKIFELGQEINALLHVVEARVSDNIKEIAKDYLLKEFAQQEFVISEESLKKANYKEHYISNAQNSLVRYILGNLQDASFTKDDWKTKKKSFSGKCVYCGKKGDIIDHAIPINRDKLGEHLLGNLVPSCKACNASKNGKDYREFLTLLKEKADDPDEKLLFEQRIDFIEKYMADSHYAPLSKHPQRDAIKKKLEDAYNEVAAIADKYAKEIGNLINS
jgi:5-methylcytosine-specific restriction endonuclease McrA